MLEVAVNPGTHRITPFTAQNEHTPFPLAVGNPYVAYSWGAVEQWSPLLALVLNYKGVGRWLKVFHEVEVKDLEADPAFPNDSFYKTPPESLQETALSSPLTAETASKWMVDFADNGTFNPADIFLIRGRRFLCEKIELTLTADGIDPVKRGYFYEVE